MGDAFLQDITKDAYESIYPLQSLKKLQQRITDNVFFDDADREMVEKTLKALEERLLQFQALTLTIAERGKVLNDFAGAEHSLGKYYPALMMYFIKKHAEHEKYLASLTVMT